MMEKMKEEVEELETKMVISNHFENIYIKQENESIDYASPVIKLEPQDIGEEIMGTSVVKRENEINVCEHQHTIKYNSLIVDKDPGVWCKDCSVISEFEENKHTLPNNVYNSLQANSNKPKEEKYHVENDELFCTIPKSEEKCNVECMYENFQIVLKTENTDPVDGDEDFSETTQLFCGKCNVLFCNPAERAEHGCDLWCEKCKILFSGPSESEKHECVLESPPDCSEELANRHTQINDLQCGLCKMTFNVQSELDSHKNTHNNKKKKKKKKKRKKVNNNENDVLKSVVENVPLWCESCNLLFCNAVESKEHVCATYNSEEKLRVEADKEISEVKSLLFCSLCNLSLNSQTELDTHMETHNSDLDDTNLNDDLTTTNEIDNFQDNLSEFDECVDQLKSSEEAEENVVCKFCNISLNSKLELDLHMEIHKKFSCAVCQKKYTHKCNLVTHMASHTGDRPFQCKHCGKTYSYSSNLIAHMRKHTGERPYSCEVCNKTFSVKQSLTHHMLIHTGEKPFQCDTCCQSFPSKKVLLNHIKIHIGARPFVCEVCNNSFVRKSGLKIHMRSHTGDRPYTCPTCNKTFAYSNSLRVHKRIHTGDNPYQCFVCGKAFSQQSNLFAHMYVHTDDRPFMCTVCRKGFCRKDDLKKHSVVHTHKHPFECTVCSKGFGRKQQLTRHMHTHNRVSSQPNNLLMPDKLEPTDFLKQEFYDSE